jgi:hypothetical protein
VWERNLGLSNTPSLLREYHLEFRLEQQQYHVHKIPGLIPILIHLNPIQTTSHSKRSYYHSSFWKSWVHILAPLNVRRDCSFPVHHVQAGFLHLASALRLSSMARSNGAVVASWEGLVAPSTITLILVR